MHCVVMMLILGGVWMLATQTATWGNLAFGLLIGLAAIVVGGEHPRVFHRLPNLWWLSRLIVVATFRIVSASFRVAALALRGNKRLAPAIIKVPLDVRGDFPVMLFANLITLSAGSLSVAFDEKRRCLYVHCIVCENEQEEVAKLKRGLERPIERVFGAR